jgi:translation initiation factor 2 subunit 3
VNLKRPVCAETGAKIAINRRVGARWRLIGIGTLG